MSTTAPEPSSDPSSDPSSPEASPPAARPDSRRVRAAAIMALYQFDQQSGRDPGGRPPDADAPPPPAPDPTDAVRAILAQDDLEIYAPTDAEAAAGAALAAEVWARVADADRVLAPLSPAWPVHRQPTVDRNILRLAWHEITTGRTKPSIAISEAVELARAFGSDRAPAFVNGVLGTFLREREGG